MDKISEKIAKVSSKDFNENVGVFSAIISAQNLDYIDENNISSKVQLEDVDQSLLCEEKSNINGKFGIEGELLVSKLNSSEINVDITGNLLISGKQKDRYEINEMGELIFNF